MFSSWLKSKDPVLRDHYSLNYLISLPKPLERLTDSILSETIVEVPASNIDQTYLLFLKMPSLNPPLVKLQSIRLIDWLSTDGIITDDIDSINKWCEYARDLVNAGPPLNREIEWKRAEDHIEEVSGLLLEVYNTKP